MTSMNTNRRRLAVALVFALVTCAFVAHFRAEGWLPNPDSVKTAREVESHSTGTPMWTNSVGFERDAFTFARIRYKRGWTGSRSGGSGKRWRGCGNASMPACVHPFIHIPASRRNSLKSSSRC